MGNTPTLLEIVEMVEIDDGKQLVLEKIVLVAINCN